MTRYLTAILLTLSAIIPAFAQVQTPDIQADTTLSDSVSRGAPQKTHVSDFAFFEQADARPLFSWGAEAGANVDLSGNNMSAIAINLSAGMRWRWIRFAGIGAEADITVSNSNRFFPIYAVFRTNFRKRPSRLFWEVRGGIALQYHENAANTTGAYVYTGVGMQLASGASFASYMSLGYTYIQRKSIVIDDETIHEGNLSNASFRIGVIF